MILKTTPRQTKTQQQKIPKRKINKTNPQNPKKTKKRTQHRKLMKMKSHKSNPFPIISKISLRQKTTPVKHHPQTPIPEIAITVVNPQTKKPNGTKPKISNYFVAQYYQAHFFF